MYEEVSIHNGVYFNDDWTRSGKLLLVFCLFLKKLNNKMKKIFKTWWKMKSFPEKELIDEIHSVIKNENVPFFIHVIVNFLWLVIIFVGCTVIVIPSILIHYIIKIVQFFVIIYMHIKKQREKEKQKKDIFEILKNYEQELLSKNGLYYLKDFTFDEKFDLYQFVNYFIISLNNRYYTYKKEDVLVCRSHKRRSLGDIFLICKTYYPDCTIEDVLKVLINLCETQKIAGSRCSDIHKFVFHKQSSVYSPHHPVEYSDKYLFEDIVEAYI